MSRIDLKNELKALAGELGFDDMGVADATNGTPYSREFTQSIAEGRHGPLDYLERTQEERADVLVLMPQAKSVVVLVKNYYTGDHSEFKPPDNSVKISRYAWGRDYHHWFKKRLRKMRTFLQEHDPAALVHIFNDTGPVLERAWANAAGLGFIGKSGMFIHRRYGTWTFLGGLVTSVALPHDAPFARDLCGSCERCMRACPTKAIVAPKTLDARSCLTTWNVERPTLPMGHAAHLRGKGWGVGCDVCQEVCPWNKFEQRTDEARFQPVAGQVFLTELPPESLQGTALARPGAALPGNWKRALKVLEGA